MPYNVLTDFHHASLLQSFIHLFKKRLGGKVYRPIGIDWATNGYWKVYDHPETQAQYLNINGATPDGTPRLNDIDGMMWEKGAKVEDEPYVYFCRDIDSGKFNDAITLNGFMRHHFDIVIASLPQHIEPYKRLCDVHPSHPKLIYQIGNAWDIPSDAVKNVMASAIVPAPPPGVNFISYHQEFDTQVFKPTGAPPIPWICSFVNVFNGQAHFAADWALFQEVERSMGEYVFKSYGGQCRDGAIGPAEKLAHEMGMAKFIWHTKNGGDGYGHVLHNAAAVGRPVITKISDYRGKLGEKLLIDGETCINIDGLGAGQIVDKIRHYAQEPQYTALCRNVEANFRAVVDFDREGQDIALFLEKLI